VWYDRPDDFGGLGGGEQRLGGMASRSAGGRTLRYRQMNSS
jgi:hypothetical protein